MEPEYINYNSNYSCGMFLAGSTPYSFIVLLYPIFDHSQNLIYTDTIDTYSESFIRKEYIKAIEGITLNRPLLVTLEQDEDVYLATTPKLPLYGVGDNWYEALEMLKREIYTLWKDLNEESYLIDEWQITKNFLNSLFGNEE